MELERLIIWGLTTLVTAFVGSYLAAYLKKKGENLATHEDIDKLVTQVAAVTRATKEIEAKISTEMWDKQKTWEIKRDAFFEAIKCLGILQDAVIGLHSAYGAASASGLPNDQRWIQGKSDALDGWNAASAGFQRARVLAVLVCGRDVRLAFNDIDLFLKKLVAKILGGDTDALPESSLEMLVNKLNTLTTAIRGELVIE